jgi:carboxypeptidase family protein
VRSTRIGPRLIPPNRLALIGLMVGALAVVSGGAQVRRQPSPTGRGLIVGQVIDAVTGRPLRDAIVTITSASQVTRDESLAATRILTTADGYFVFRDLARGNFTVRAAKQGYTDGVAGRRRPGGPSQPIALADGERVGDVAVRMWRPGALAGTVVDEAGEALVNIRVRAFRRTVGAGRPQFIGAATATTNDRGEYRLGGLVPGEYIVLVPARQVVVAHALAREVQAGRLHPPRDLGAALSPEAKAVQVEDSLIALDGSPLPPPRSAERLFYPPTFHPSALTIDLTVPLTISAGEERGGIDLQLQPVPTLRVSGLVVGPDGAAAGIPVRLWPKALDDFALEQDATTTTADGNGAFSFPAVPSGHYSLRVSSVQADPEGRISPLQPGRWADVPIAVGKEDLDAVVLTLNDALRIRGHIELENTRQTASSVRLGPVQMLVQSAGGSPALATAPPSTPSDGDFTIGGLSPGRYFVRPAGSPAGWTLKTVMYNGRDISEAPLEVQENVDGVVVTFTEKSTLLRGVVRLPQGQADAGAIVIAFPTDVAAWPDFGPSPRRVRSAWTSKVGEYSIGGLPPGEYHLVALPDDKASEWRDPVSLRALARVATQVAIRDGEQKTQDLRTRPSW